MNFDPRVLSEGFTEKKISIEALWFIWITKRDPLNFDTGVNIDIQQFTIEISFVTFYQGQLL